MALHYSEQQIVLEKGGLTYFWSGKYTECVHYGGLFLIEFCDLTFLGSTDSESEKVSTDAEDTNNRLLPNVLGYPQFPAANTEEGRYHQSVLVSMERWFSLFGWPGGPHLITIPHTLRKNSQSKCSHAQVLVLCRVSETSTNPTLDHKDSDGNLPITSQPLTSNIYSLQELQLLSWLNVHYQIIFPVILCWSTGGVPAARWIVNFDLDLTDGLVLAALLAAYCPYLIESHFQRMYTTASSLEKILHNNIIVTQALTALGLNINIQVNTVEDDLLPQYLPIDSISLSGGLHSTLSKKVGHIQQYLDHTGKFQRENTLKRKDRTFLSELTGASKKPVLQARRVPCVDFRRGRSSFLPP
uniref:Calponin-homology (CH) domain-containing protein n=1 Tax=Gouania willdenowi TaxID=441366 RepID=A0A8C5G7J8_GOUWI